ncbi:MAG: serine/threonine-protein kinase [Gemmatimonas sp.]
MLDQNDAATQALIRATAGQYRVDNEVGRGGMGIVYLGVDLQLERPVAIKTLPPHLAVDAKVRKRFITEARTAGALSHPNIVPIYAASERDGVVYFAMRYINGESLAERIARLGPLPPAEVVGMMRQLASALGYAHANGVVHRDIKAENVLLDSETNRAMLTDFGIARLNESQALTATGTVLGTVHYMSPEQVTGEQLDGRSDLYSLGVLAFLALCGKFPFDRPNASAVVVAHVTSPPPKLCSMSEAVPSQLGDLIDRLLSKMPGDRYADGQALRQALDALQLDGAAAPTASSTHTAYIARTEAVTPARAVAAPVPAAVMGASPVASSFAAVPTDASAERMSSMDAEQVWARAAELQANTGMIVPPSSFKLNAGANSETVGFDAATVRASALDAGIDARYVDRALEERARASSVARRSDAYAAAAGIRDSTAQKANPFLGARTKIEYETSFDGELNSDGFEEVADEVRLALGEMVTVSAVGRTMTVTSAGGGGSRNHSPRRVQIHISSRNGRTTVRAFEDLKNSAANLFVGISVGGGVGAGSAVMGAVIAATRNPAIGFATMGATMAVGFGIARFFFTRSVKKREEELRNVLSRVVARAQKVLPAASVRPLPRR